MLGQRKRPRPQHCTYRVAGISDLDNLAKLHAQSWREAYRGIFADEYLDKEVWEERKIAWAKRLASPLSNQYILVAVDNDEICGFICVLGDHHDKWGTFIDNLHVAKSAQGKGVGKQLMYLAAKWADEQFEHKGIYLEVLEDNFSAREFYHKLGAKHLETNLWQPPGSENRVNDLIYAWENNLALLQLNQN